VLERACNGCELCLASCPVDCIVMRPRGAGAGAPAAAENRARYERHRTRTQRSVQERRRCWPSANGLRHTGRAALAMSPANVRSIFEQLRAANPSPRSELLYDSRSSC